MVDLLGLPRGALSAHLDATGVGARHTARVFRGLHALGLPLDQIEGLGRHAATLAASGALAVAEVVERAPADDGTTRLRHRLDDGAEVESVLVPMPGDRTTLCVSTQVGCAMACTFCATGTLGLRRSLRAGEIVAQLRAADAEARALGRQIRRVVYMGMGEPLHAYEAMLDSVRVITDGGGRGLAARNVTVSTVGLVERMGRFLDDTGGRVQLALSLHAGTDATRRQIVPAARTRPLADVKAALLSRPLPRGQYLMLEYVVLPGLNDGEAEADGVAAFAAGLPAIVNLIPWNPWPGAPHAAPTWAEVCALSDRLQARGVAVSVRRPRGRETAGACGQLVAGGQRRAAPPAA